MEVSEAELNLVFFFLGAAYAAFRTKIVPA